jgi:glycosyltransferase involved in cell wall biosynthesis
MPPSVTALIAAYNAEAFVGDAIDSALRQDYPPALLDVVVVDDGSTDETAAVVEDRAQRSGGRVRMLRQGNAGNASATNLAMGHVRGELIALLDADDMWPADKTSRQVAALEPGIDLVYGDMTLVDAGGAVLEESWLGMIAGGRPPSGRCFGALLEVGTATSSSILMRTTLARALTPIPPDVPIPDWWFSLAAARRGPIGYTAEPRTLYRFHGANRSLGSEGPVLRRAFLRRAGVQRWFLRRLCRAEVSARELAAAWESFERNAVEANRISGSAFGATLIVSDEDRHVSRALATAARASLECGRSEDAMIAYARSAAADPWHDEAREGLADALALAAEYTL